MTPRRALVATALLPLAVVAVCVVQLGIIKASSAHATSLEDEALERDLPCYGVEALADPGCTPPYGDELTPALPTAFAEFARSTGNTECLQVVSRSDVLRCEFGSPRSETTVALVGDSHALAWLPAAQLAAEERDWRLVTYLRAACPVNAAVTERYVPGEQGLCDTWSTDVIDEVTSDPEIDLVMTAALNTVTWVPSDGRSPYETGRDGYIEAWTAWADAGKSVLAMEETPLPRPDVLECLALRSADECGRPESEASQPGPSPLQAAALRLGRSGLPVELLEVRDFFCTDGRCPAVAGNVVIYVDGDHVSPAYMRTLSGRVGEGWDHILADGAGPGTAEGAPRG